MRRLLTLLSVVLSLPTVGRMSVRSRRARFASSYRRPPVAARTCWGGLSRPALPGALTPEPGTAQQPAVYMRSETAKWKALVEGSGATAE